MIVTKLAMITLRDECAQLKLVKLATSRVNVEKIGSTC